MKNHYKKLWSIEDMSFVNKNTWGFLNVLIAQTKLGAARVFLSPEL